MDSLSVLSLFSGGGGLDLGARLVRGFRTIAYVENDPYAQGVLMSNMRKGILDPAPIWDDVRTFDGRYLCGRIDVVAGGFPCQDLSVAGKKAGIEAGARSGLWKEFARIIREARPRFVLVENVPGLLLYGQLGIVLGDLADLGFDAQWQVLSAAAVGAPHLRERVWIVGNAFGRGWSWESWGRSGAKSENGHLEMEKGNVADPQRSKRRLQQITKSERQDSAIIGNDGPPQSMADPDRKGRKMLGRSKQDGLGESRRAVQMADAAGERRRKKRTDSERPTERPAGGGDVANAEGDGWKSRGTECTGQEWLTASLNASWWATEPGFCRVVNGLAFRSDRLRCLGNGVVPLQSAPAWQKIADMALT